MHGRILTAFLCKSAVGASHGGRTVLGLGAPPRWFGAVIRYRIKPGFTLFASLGNMTRIITVTSGKGGVGKTNICVNLALRLARRGYRTCLFDADLGLANINILLRLYPRHSLEHVILNQCGMEDIIIRDHEGIDIIPGSSGMERMANLESAQVERMVESFSSLTGYDFFLLDTSAGVSNHVISFCMAAPEVILVITPEPTSLTDAYSLLKVLSLNGFSGKVKLVVNQSKNATIAKHAYNKFQDVVKQHLSIQTSALGIVVQDPHVTEAVKAQQPLVSLFPDSSAARCIDNLALQLIEDQPDGTEAAGVDVFWRRCIDLLSGSKRAAVDKGEIIPRPAAEEPKAEVGGGARSGTEITVAQEAQFAPALVHKLIDAVNAVSGEIRELRAMLRAEHGNASPAQVRQGETAVGAGGARVAKVITETVDRAINGFDVRRELTLPDNLWSVAIGETELAQVVDDVVGYAARVTVSGRAVRVRAENVTITTDSSVPLSPGRYGKITVTDQGVGVPREFLHCLIDTSPNAAPARGLARAGAIIKRYHGCVSAESELESGSVFSIYVPAHFPEATWSGRRDK